MSANPAGSGPARRGRAAASLRFWYLAAAVLAVAGIALNLGLASGTALGRVAGWLVDLLGLAVMALGGRAARLRGGRPGWTGLFLGWIASVPPAVVRLLVPPSAAELEAALRASNLNLTLAQIQQAVEAARSPLALGLGLVGAIVVGGALGALLGWIGSLFAREARGDGEQATGAGTGGADA